MAGGRPILALVSLILVAAGILFQFFVILSGATLGSPENKFYFLRADTSRIRNAPATAAWTFFAVCDYDNGSLTSCGPKKAALPFDPVRNFDATRNVPPQFLGTHHFYYISRFMFAFYLIALFFAVLSLFCGLLALCTRIGAYLSGMLTSIAVFFQAITAALMTAWAVQGRNAFHKNGMDAHIGSYSFGFTWGAFAAFFVSMILFCGAGAAGGRKNTSYEGKQSRWGMFGRKRSTRSREGVKDEYS